MSLPQIANSSQTRPSVLPNTATEPHFTSFSRLPVELRLQVWSLAMPQPRVVSILQERQLNSKRRLICPNRKVTDLLYANHESRTEALKKYDLVLADQLRGRPVYFDFNQDTLLLGDITVFNYCFDVLGAQFYGYHEQQPCHFEKMKFLAIPQCPSTNPSAHVSGLTFSGLTKFANLQKVTFWNLMAWLSVDGDDQSSTAILLPSNDLDSTLRHFRDIWNFAARQRHQSDFRLPQVEVLSYQDFEKQFCS